MAKQRGDRFTELEERYAGYEVYDRDGEKIGKVDDLFVDEKDSPEYIGVKMGFLGTRSTLIPIDIVTMREERGVIEVAAAKDKVKDGPSFDDDEKITPEYEERVRSHYGLRRSQGPAERGSYGDYYAGEGRAGLQPGERFGSRERAGEGRHPSFSPGDADRERGEFRERPASPEHEGAIGRGGDLEDEDEIKVQRSEEELRAGTREREAGGMRVRKRVRIDREQIRVPKRREEVHVERVPVEGREAPEAEIGEDEIFVPVTEEEVVVEKRPVVKEEIRLRKDVTQDEEVVEEDVRKEEVDVDEQATRHGAHGRAADDETRRRNR